MDIGPLSRYYLDMCPLSRYSVDMCPFSRYCVDICLHSKGRRQNTQQRMTKGDKSLLVSLQNSAILFLCKSRQRFDKGCLQFTKRH